MKHIFVNLKRFDIPATQGGINRLAPVESWGSILIEKTQEALSRYPSLSADFVFYLPEAHLLSASSAIQKDGAISLGCQSVYRENVSPGGNFGALTSLRPAAAAKALGCRSALIGHCEERLDKTGILAEAGVTDSNAVNRILNREILCALQSGLSVLYCIGEHADEHDRWEEILAKQLDIGLQGVDHSKICIAYEPIWSVGPGRTPAGREHIQRVARFVKAYTNGLPVVYGGGLKQENAEMLASIQEIDGGLIALTRFSGEIGFYPDEFAQIVHTYLKK